MANYFFAAALQPRRAEPVVCTAEEPLEISVTSRSPTARATAAAKNGHWVFTVVAPQLAAPERHESRAGVMARHARAAIGG